MTTKNTEYKILIMNRHERRKLKSKKGGRYRGLKRPTDDGVANGGKKTYG